MIRTILGLLVLLLLVAVAARADESPATDAAPVRAPRAAAPALEALVPELGAHPYRLAPGPRPYAHRFAVSPAFGTLGTDRLFLIRAAFNPSPWLGYEAEIGHAPSQAVQAIIHRFDVVLRRPMPGRFQPFVSGGYGMMVVLPGRSLNADAVTKNMLAMGGGLEVFLRDDLAIRAEARRSTVIGRQQNRSGVVTYDYREATFGLSFYRAVQP